MAKENYATIQSNLVTLITSNVTLNISLCLDCYQNSVKYHSVNNCTSFICKTAYTWWRHLEAILWFTITALLHLPELMSCKNLLTHRYYQHSIIRILHVIIASKVIEHLLLSKLHPTLRSNLINAQKNNQKFTGYLTR